MQTPTGKMKGSARPTRSPENSFASTEDADKDHKVLEQEIFSRIAITSTRVAPKPERILPLREEQKLRDAEARARLLRGKPVVDQDESRRPDFATAMTVDQFRSSPRRGRR